MARLHISMSVPLSVVAAAVVVSGDVIVVGLMVIAHHRHQPPKQHQVQVRVHTASREHFIIQKKKAQKPMSLFLCCYLRSTTNGSAASFQCHVCLQRCDLSKAGSGGCGGSSDRPRVSSLPPFITDRVRAVCHAY